MDDVGFQGTGSRFNTRFGSGDDIYASQLNGLSAGIQSALGMPYLGAGQSVSFVPGGNLITGPSPVESGISVPIDISIGLKYVNHYQIEVGTLFLGEVLIPTPILKVAKGGNVWRPAASNCTTEYRADYIMTDGTLPVVSGSTSQSPWASNDGYIVIEPGVTYYVYAFKLETAAATAFYIYVSTDGSLVNACPVPMPGGFSPPVGIDYDFQGILLGTATYTLPFFPVIEQFVVGSITWPNLPSTGTEYVNHYEAKVESIVVDDTTELVLRVGMGGNIWNPSPSTAEKALEKRADVITTDPDISPTVNGMDSNSPWASNDGYVPTDATSLYVYAFRVDSAGGSVTDFYIYVSDKSTLVAGTPVALPAGITPPTGSYTVQGLRVADVIWNGISSTFDISQRVVGSITWPDYVPPRIIQQFECVVDSVSTEGGPIDALRIAKGDILWTSSRFTYPEMQINPLQGHAKKLWVYPTGTLTEDVDVTLPWVNGGGYVALDVEQTYFVYIIGNQEAPYFGGAVSLAVIAQGSDANSKSRPFNGYMGRNWQSVFTNGLVVDGSEVFSPYFQFSFLANYNCQRYLIATVSHDGTKWNVAQYLYGPVTLSDDLVNAGPRLYPVDYSPTTEYSDKQDEWNGAWSGSTKDGSPTDATDIVWVP